MSPSPRSYATGRRKEKPCIQVIKKSGLQEAVRNVDPSADFEAHVFRRYFGWEYYRSEATLMIVAFKDFQPVHGVLKARVQGSACGFW